MARYQNKPVVIEATRWHKNGDHPNDRDGQTFQAKVEDWEGAVVRYFRSPDVSGDVHCKLCGFTMHYHGWLDTGGDGQRVCPGDWVITELDGERYPMRPDIFDATYERV